MGMCYMLENWQMQLLSLLSLVILSKAENWVRYLSFPQLYIALYCFLDFMAHQIIRYCKNGKSVYIFFFSAGIRKMLFVSIFLLILANIKSTSLNVEHFFMPCVSLAVLEILFPFLYFWKLLAMLFLKYCSWFIFQTYCEKSCHCVHFMH